MAPGDRSRRRPPAASLYTGFRSATELANWGLLDGDARALAKANAVFRTRHAPHTPDHF